MYIVHNTQTIKRMQHFLMELDFSISEIGSPFDGNLVLPELKHKRDDTLR